MAEADAENAPPAPEESKPMDVAPTEPSEPGTDMPPDLEEGEGEDEGEGAVAPRARLEFIFDDEKKKKKKKKKGKPAPVKRPSKAQYERTITDLNGILAQLNRKVMRLDEFNMKRNDELVQTKEAHKEIGEHLKRVFAKHTRNLTIEEEYNTEMIKKCEDLEIESQTTIKTLQTQYKNTQSQLNGEIEMLSTKLNTLRVFSDARDEMLHKLSDMEVEYKQSDQRHKDRLYAMQQKSVVERNKLDKDAKARFRRIVDDFNEWREVRNAAYTRRLLSENSELRRKYNKLVPLNLRKERDLNVLLEKTASVKDTYAAVFDITQQLENTQVKRNTLLEKLEKFQRFYRLQVVLGSKYRRLYEAVKKQELKEDKKYDNANVLTEDLEAQSVVLMEKLQNLKQAERDYLHTRQQYDKFVKGVRRAIFSLCSLPEYQHHFPQSFNEYNAKRNGILKGLIDLITNCERKLTTKALLKAQYYKGYLGFMPLDSVICQILKCKSCTESVNLENMPSYCMRLSNWSGFSNTDAEQEEDNYSDPGLMCLK